MADTDLGLSDRDKELKKWNAPYRYQEFPKALFRGTTTTGGRIEVEDRVVTSEDEQRAAQAVGWVTSPQTALARETAEQEAVGTAAAERAWTDRHMSASAQAEAAAADQAAGAKHLGEVKERPRRPRPSRKPKKEATS